MSKFTQDQVPPWLGTTNTGAEKRTINCTQFPWWQHVSQTVQQQVFSALTFPLTELAAFHLYYANFVCDTSTIYVAGEPIGYTSVSSLQEIQRQCAKHLRYVPMIRNNLQFETDVVVHTPRPVLQDLTFRNVFSGQIMGYREKIDGALVWRSRVTFEGQTYEMHVGAISMPAFIQVDQFEMDGLEAYSIQPHNVATTVVYPFTEIQFRPRSTYPAPDPKWADGTVALLWQDGKMVERRLKKFQSSELRFTDGHTSVNGYDFFSQVNDLPLDGVYECVYVDGNVSPIGYRPFKTHDPNFMFKLNFPDILQAPILSYKYEESPLGFGVFGETVHVPLTQYLPYSFASPVLSDHSVILQLFDERSNIVKAATYLDGERITLVTAVSAGSMNQISINWKNASSAVSHGTQIFRPRFSLGDCVLTGEGVVVTRSKSGAFGQGRDGRPLEFEPSRMQGVDHLISQLSQAEFERVFLPQNLAYYDKGGGRWRQERTPVASVHRLQGNEFFPPTSLSGLEEVASSEIILPLREMSSVPIGPTVSTRPKVTFDKMVKPSLPQAAARKKGRSRQEEKEFVRAISLLPETASVIRWFSVQGGQGGLCLTHGKTTCVGGVKCDCDLAVRVEVNGISKEFVSNRFRGGTKRKFNGMISDIGEQMQDHYTLTPQGPVPKGARKQDVS